MSDPADEGNDAADFFLSVSLRKAQAEAKPAISTGHCLFCDEDVDDNRRWCDAECLKAWEKYRERA